MTVYFSNPPERVVADAPAEAFLAGPGFGDTNPPNAALVTESEDGQTVVALPDEFGAASLFIDDCSNTSTNCFKGGTEIGTDQQGMCWNWGGIEV